MFEAEARLATIQASRILHNLAEVWGRRFPVRADALTAEVSLDEVELAMTADGDSLAIRLASRDRASFEEAMANVSRHLGREMGEGNFTLCNWHILGDGRTRS